MSRKNRRKQKLHLVTENSENPQTPMGRPPDPFDFETFEKLCGLPKVITQEDIAWIMRCSVDKCSDEVKKKYPGMTLAEFRDKMGGQFRQTLLTAQIIAAQKGNAAMLIWLGKQYLGQTDDPEPVRPPDANKTRLIIDLSGDSVRQIESEAGTLGTDENSKK